MLTGHCGSHWVDIDIGKNHHYRKKCTNASDNHCDLANTAVRDDRVWTHLDTVITNSKIALQKIDFESNQSQLNSLLQEILTIVNRALKQVNS